jgi:hypothetical protein
LTQVNAAASRARICPIIAPVGGLRDAAQDLVVYVVPSRKRAPLALAARLAARMAPISPRPFEWVREIPRPRRDAPYHRVDRLLDAAARNVPPRPSVCSAPRWRASWRRPSGAAAASIRCATAWCMPRHADLAIVGQIDPVDHSLLVPQLSPEVSLRRRPARPRRPLCRPVRGVGERVLIAWNAGREAARAVNDALPFLTRAQQRLCSP